MFSLALETSSSVGSIALGREDELVATAQVPQHRRHNLELMPAIARLCDEHGVKPADLTEAYVSIGPGSFTGLRIGIATAKMLAMTVGVKLVAVPTLDVLVRQAPRDASPVAAALNLKRDTMWSAVYAWRDERWSRVVEPALRTIGQILETTPAAILGDPLPPLPGVKVLPPGLAVPRSEDLWRLGRDAARRGEFTEAMALSPLYAREPEAVALWENRTTEKQNSRKA